MKVMKWSAIALAVSAGSTQFAVADAFVSDQAEAKGFIEDSSLDLLLRNYYFNRDGKSGSGDRVDWTQGFLTTYESGFTQGTVGFGVDAFGYLGLKLDGTSDKTGTGNLPVMNDGKPRDDYSRAGGALKVRISKTMLKWGEMQPTAPVFAAGGSRLFPQTATGFQLQSSELARRSAPMQRSGPARDRPMLWARSLGYRQTFDFACLVAHCAALPRRINFAAFTVTPAAFSDCPPSLA